MKLLFGADGLCNSVVEKLELNTIKGLSGSQGRLESYIVKDYQVPHTGPAWCTLFTGLDEKGHGLTERGWKEGDSIFDRIYTVFDKLSDSGFKLGLFNLPMTYPSKEINGWMFSGFPATTLKSIFYRCFYPKELNEKVKNLRKNSDQYITKIIIGGAAPNKNNEVLDKLYEAEENKLKAFKKLVTGREDLVAYGTTLADKVGHIAGINPEEDETIRAYKFVDNLLKRLINFLAPEEVIIFSDHGFKKYHHNLDGFYHTTSGNKLESIFDITPEILKRFGIEYKKEEFGKLKEKKEDDITKKDEEEIKEQLHVLGYI